MEIIWAKTGEQHKVYAEIAWELGEEHGDTLYLIKWQEVNGRASPVDEDDKVIYLHDDVKDIIHDFRLGEEHYWVAGSDCLLVRSPTNNQEALCMLNQD